MALQPYLKLKERWYSLLASGCTDFNTVYEIYKLIHNTKREFDMYNNTPSSYRRTTVKSFDDDPVYRSIYIYLGNYLLLSVKRAYFTVYEYLTSKCDASVRYEDDTAVARAITVDGWGAAPIRVLVENNILDKFLASKNMCY